MMTWVWGLMVWSAALVLMLPCTSASTTVSEAPTTWFRSASEETGTDGSIGPSVSTVHSGTGSNQSATVPERPPSIISTGVLTKSEYLRMRQALSYFALSVEPVALVLLVLSALAFLQDRQFASNHYLAAVCLFEAWYILMLFSHYLTEQWPRVFSSLTYTHMSIWTVSYSGLSARRCVYVFNGLLSLQRFLAIAFPLKFRRLRLLQKPCIPLVAIFLYTFLLNLHRPLQFTPVLIQDGRSGSWTIGFSALFRRQKKAFLAVADLSRYSMLYIPMSVALLCNCLMVCALSRHHKDLSKMSEASAHTQQDIAKSKMERQMTVTILVSTFLMLLFNTPTNINEAVSMYSRSYGVVKQDHYLYVVMRSCFSLVSQVCDVLIALSYLILSASFRHRFLSLFRPVRHVWCRQPAPHRPAFVSDTSLSSAVPSVTNTVNMQLDSVADG